MATINDLKKFYACCMNCPNTSKECPSILRNKEMALIPRGFYFKSQYFESPRKILVVANNPGTPAEGEEEYYENRRRLDLVNAHLEFMRTVDKRSLFHKRLRERYLPVTLKLPKDKVFNHSAFTNLIKCTAANKGMFASSHLTVKKCFNKWFKKELRLYRPEAILAVGRPTEKFLKKNTEIFGMPSRCIIYVKHPARGGYGKEREPMELQKIRKKLNKCI